jgi:ABC-2 type transport system ATP-binding protein
VFDKPLQAKRLIGYLPEQPPLYEDMTPMEFLAFVAEAKGVDAERVIRQVKEVLELTDLTEMKDRLIGNLSKGCRQRVGIAQALLGNPEIIILDEPTVGLDPRQLIEIRALIRKLGEEHTVIISSHILSEISEICDELLVISGGRLVAQGTLEELENHLGMADMLHLVVRGDKKGVLEVLSGIVGEDSYQLCPSKHEDEVAMDVSVPHNSDIRDRIFFAMADRRYVVSSMEAEHKSLEDVFLALTGESKEQEEEQES